MTDEEQIRQALWALVKSHGSQYATCKALNLPLGYFNRILSGAVEPSDKFCKLVGWCKVIKYEKLQE